MRHLDDGLLRRMFDEPLAVAAADQRHYEDCQECRARFNTIAGQAQAVGLMLAAPAFEPRPEEALASMRVRIQSEEAKAPVRWHERVAARVERRWDSVRRPLVVAVLAAGVLGAMGATGAAQKLITIFEPQGVVGVQVSPSDFSGATDPFIFGKLKWTPAAPEMRLMADATAASKESGLHLLVASLPSGVSSTVSYGVVDHASASFTFDGAKAKAEAARRGKKINEMPAGIDGSTLFISAGPALVQIYGSPAVGNAVETPLPLLVIGQSRVPVITSTGATTKQLKDYVLSQPGMPPDLVEQIRAIDDPSTTLPIPIPRGLATSRQVDVQGVKGLLVDAGIAAGVVWVKDGIIYGVAGQLTPDQVLLIANSLH